MFRCDALQASANRAASVIEEDVEFAEMLHRQGDGRGNIRLLGNIRLAVDHLTAKAVSELLAFFFRATDYNNARTFSGK